MELDDFKKSWNQQNSKLDAILKINVELICNQKKSQLKSHFNTFIMFRWIEIAFSSIVVIIMSNFIYDNFNDLHFLISGLSLEIFALAGISNSIRRIMTVSTLDYTEPTVSIQKKLSVLKSQILVYIRFGIISIPFFPIYIILGFKMIFNFDIWRNGDSLWWMSNIILSVLFIPVSYWLYRKINYNNIHITWVRSILKGSGGKQLLDALEMLKEIEEFEKEK